MKNEFEVSNLHFLVFNGFDISFSILLMNSSNSSKTSRNNYDISYSSALLFNYPFEYLNSNYEQNDLISGIPNYLYCAFCGKFLSSSNEGTYHCKGTLCNAISNKNTAPSQVLNQIIGPLPVRTTPKF